MQSYRQGPLQTGFPAFLMHRNKILKLLHCDFIESGSKSILMSRTKTRGCGLARYGDGLQRSLRSYNVLADDEQWVS
ncbi:MAG: hypothetical protein CVV32_03965 [Methanomicrobiales archaeon HGW-Methanomicrobiales-3]|nr:MAG: hypothetical protein CVV32_03965 [Methanomicrobiales archaeon HGW-Methanomicrobiales-3]